MSARLVGDYRNGVCRLFGAVGNNKRGGGGGGGGGAGAHHTRMGDSFWSPRFLVLDRLLPELITQE